MQRLHGDDFVVRRPDPGGDADFVSGGISNPGGVTTRRTARYKAFRVD